MSFTDGKKAIFATGMESEQMEDVSRLLEHLGCFRFLECIEIVSAKNTESCSFEAFAAKLVSEAIHDSYPYQSDALAREFLKETADSVFSLESFPAMT